LATVSSATSTSHQQTQQWLPLPPGLIMSANPAMATPAPRVDYVPSNLLHVPWPGHTLPRVNWCWNGCGL